MSGNASGSKSKFSSSSTQRVWGEQSPYLKDLYSQAQQQTGASQPATQQAQDAYSGMGGEIGNLFNQAKSDYGTATQPYDQLGEQASSTLQGMMTQDPVNNPYLQQNVENALGSVSQNFQRNILPSIRSDAQGAGQYGSSRQGIAEGLAMSDANKQASDMAQSMYGQAYDQGMQNRLQASGQAQGLMGQGTQSALGNIQGYGDLANLGLLQGGAYQQAGQAGFAPLAQYANIVGGPTALTDSTSKSSSRSFGGGGGM